MEKSMIDMVAEFMVASGQNVNQFNFDQVSLYYGLVEEEYEEFVLEKPMMPEGLKELCDLIWVAIGVGLSCGYRLEDAFKELHRSNMSKLVDGKLLKRDDGKVLKGPNYSPADMSGFV